MKIDIFDKTREPSLEDMTNYIEGKAKERWRNILEFITNNYNSKPNIMYSKCSAKPGWNVKYKKNGKALCTLYPDKDYFTALIVLNNDDMEWLKGMRNDYTTYFLNLFDNCGLFNGTKWLMIEVRNDKILEDIKNIIDLKLSK